MRRPPENQLVLVETEPFARGPGRLPRARSPRAARPSSLLLPLAAPAAPAEADLDAAAAPRPARRRA